MGLFSRKDKEDFLTQQAREEGRLTDFEESSQAEIRGCTDGFGQSEMRNEESCRTHNQTPQDIPEMKPPTQNPPLNLMSSGLTKGISYIAQQVKEEILNNSPQAIRKNNEPLYRQYRQPNQQNTNKMSDDTKKGLIGAVIVLCILSAAFAPGLIGLIVLIAIIAIIGKNNKKR